eukprot:Gregarina_sp_Pseudo_9__694@NODE_1441_length_1599_cov_25_331410_g1338_i0_p1_GENE_NODE_1441_length_1599_cov_25_331410_g1338_i0NODE_1441_length_1599_cov_25_331410_g1338_i0_p1_ORF_typecomplete_len324_score34_66Fbox/PF00646_33/0_091_NODE_1441_length_1599_cov_25_331410_g1338_i02401211
MAELPECVLTQIYDLLCIAGRLKFGCLSRTFRAHCHLRSTVLKDLQLVCHITNTFVPARAGDKIFAEGLAPTVPQECEEKRPRKRRRKEEVVCSRVDCLPPTHTCSRRLLCLARQWWKTAAKRLYKNRETPWGPLATDDPSIARVNAALREVLLPARYRCHSFVYGFETSKWPMTHAYLEDCYVVAKELTTKLPEFLSCEAYPVDSSIIAELEWYFAPWDMRREFVTAKILERKDDPERLVQRLLTDPRLAFTYRRLPRSGKGESELSSWLEKLIEIAVKFVKPDPSTGEYTIVTFGYMEDYCVVCINGEESSLVFTVFRGFG